MKIELIVDGVAFGEGEIDSFDYDSEVFENSKGAVTTLTLTIHGNIFVNVMTGTENTLKLEEWSRVSASIAQCYRSVEIKAKDEGMIVRNIKFPYAFVVDYIEEYGDIEGDAIGRFTLKVRQKGDLVNSDVNYNSIEISGGFEA